MTLDDLERFVRRGRVAQEEVDRILSRASTNIQPRAGMLVSGDMRTSEKGAGSGCHRAAPAPATERKSQRGE